MWGLPWGSLGTEAPPPTHVGDRGRERKSTGIGRSGLLVGEVGCCGEQRGGLGWEELNRGSRLSSEKPPLF